MKEFKRTLLEGIKYSCVIIVACWVAVNIYTAAKETVDGYIADRARVQIDQLRDDIYLDLDTLNPGHVYWTRRGRWHVR